MGFLVLCLDAPLNISDIWKKVNKILVDDARSLDSR